MKKIMALFIAFAFILSGCGILESPDTTQPTDSAYVPNELDGPPVKADFAKTDADQFTDADLNSTYSPEQSAVITLAGTSISCDAPSVVISGTTATITKGGTYIIRGGLADGSIVVNVSTKDKPHLVFDGAQINSATSAALYIKSAGKVFLTLAEGSQNTLSNGGSFVSNDGNIIDGAVFAKPDLTINGSGKLTVNSPAAHGIVCKDDLAVTGGDLTINSAFHAIDVNDSVRIKDSTLTMDSGKDGIHAEDADNAATGFVYISGGSLQIDAEGDGISAALTAQIGGCTADICAGGGYENGEDHSSGYGDFMGGGMGPGGMPPGGPRPGGRATAATDTDSTSMKGIKAGKGLLISSGKITVDAADDALHSDTLLIVNGGNIQLASGDDGIHAETDLSLTAGVVKITNCYEGLEAQNIRIIGGDISMICMDDGMNAAGGVDGSGEGGRDQMAPSGGPGGPGGASDGSVEISGGKLYVQASGDGIDSNGYLKITGGYTVVCGPNSGDTAILDYDTYGQITGGIFIGTGSSMMAQSLNSDSQGVIAINAGRQSAGVTVTVTNAEGRELLSHVPGLDFSVFIFSAPELTRGQSYHVTAGTVEGDVTAS